MRGMSNVSANVLPAPWNCEATYVASETRMTSDPTAASDRRAVTAPARAMTSVDVSAPPAWLMRRSPGARTSQLSRNPPTHAGSSQMADTPEAYAKPLTPSRVHADEELADALSEATTGPSRRPPR